MSYQWEIGFWYCGSRIRDLIWTLQQNHVWNVFKVSNKITRTTPPCSSVSILNFEQVNASWVCLFLATSFQEPLRFLIRRKASSFISKAKMLWEQGCVFSCSMKIELTSLTQVSDVTKKLKNRWAKKAKKLRKC